MTNQEEIKALRQRLSIQAGEIERLQQENDALKEIAIISNNKAIMNNTIKNNTSQIMTEKLAELNANLQDMGLELKRVKDRLRNYEDID